MAFPASAKDRNWQAGTLIDSVEQSYTVSTVSTEQGKLPGIIDGGRYSSQKTTREIDNVWQEYTIESVGVRYTAKQPLPWRWSKAAAITIGGPVWFVIEKRNLYLIDDTGKEYKLELLQRLSLPTVPSNAEPIDKEEGLEARVLTNDDVLKLKDAGLSDMVVIEKIKASPSAFSLDTDDLLSLKQAGISDTIIAAMIRADNAKAVVGGTEPSK